MAEPVKVILIELGLPRLIQPIITPLICHELSAVRLFKTYHSAGEADLLSLVKWLANNIFTRIVRSCTYDNLLIVRETKDIISLYRDPAATPNAGKQYMAEPIKAILIGLGLPRLI